MRIVQTLLLLLVLLVSAVDVFAAAGDLDPTFGSGKGWVSTGLQGVPVSAIGLAMVRQMDGKLVVAGSRHAPSGKFALVRYNVDGTLDTTFNTFGKLTTEIFGEASGVIQQTDGKLVVVGFTGPTNNLDIVLVRYNSDGSLDKTFDDDGMIIMDVNGFSNDLGSSIIQQADGKLVVAGYSKIYNGNDSDFVLIRYNNDGSLDATFNGNGKLIIDLSANSDDYARSVIQQVDGKLVVAGETRSNANTDFALVRCNADGTLDATFNGNGKVVTAIGTAGDESYSLLQQLDGKLVIAGSANDGLNADFGLVRYNNDGSLDTNFNATGKVRIDIGGNDSIFSVIQQSDGKLVATGYKYNINGYDLVIVRFNSNGLLDSTFNGNGKVILTGIDQDEGRSVIQQPDNKLVVLDMNKHENYYNFVLLRYKNNGSLDATFNATGRVSTNFDESNDAGSSVIQQTDGKLVVVGTSQNGESGTDGDFSLVRYNSDATLDASFNNIGKVKTDIESFSNDTGTSVIQQKDGKLVVAGSSTVFGSHSDFALVRYNIDGTIDTTFNATGKLTMDFGLEKDDFANSILQQADGKLVVAGTSDKWSGNSDFALARYNLDGSLDASFGGGGEVTTDLYALNYDFGNSVIQQADGKLVVAGDAYSYSSTYGMSNYHFALVRYNSDGSLDATFNGVGKVITAIGGYDHANSVIQQADGKLVVAGYSLINNNNEAIALARYNIDGTLDLSFDNDGIVILDIDSAMGHAYSVAQQSDGKLVVTGDTYSNASEAILLARYNIDGSLDLTFNNTGKIIKSFYPLANYGASIIQQKNGLLVVAGYSSEKILGTQFLVARFESGQIDTDGDGFVDGLDAFPLNPAESADTDHDSIGNNADWDDDGDGVPDTVDAAPLNAADTSEITLPLNAVYKGGLLKNSIGR